MGLVRLLHFSNGSPLREDTVYPGVPIHDRPAGVVLRDNQNHARCDNQASLPAVSVVQRKLHPEIMMSGCQAGVKPGPLGPRLWRLRA